MAILARMLFALIDGKKSQATPGMRGSCPFCQSSMVPKCGDYVSWHWAHKRMKQCDSWSKEESQWHLSWKQIFGLDNCEVILKKNNQKHFADIKTIHGRVIELQNSPINKLTITSREEFYGADMAWIINGQNFAQNFLTRPINGTSYDEYTPEFDKQAKINGFTPHYKSLDGDNWERFQWKRSQLVWSNANADVYIDFGDEYLFHMKEGKGCSSGTGVSLSKKRFILANGGDESLISLIVNPKF